MAVGEEESVVNEIINSAAALRSETLDLGRKGLYEIPKEILNLKHLESLHLEGNYLTALPEEFFEKLTSLKWLDLRNNRLSTLPVSVGRHRSLRSLLLEANLLTHLPCELGMAKSLCGLNLSGNPLEFPPPHVVKKGTQEVLKFLREMSGKTDWTEKCPDTVSSDSESEDVDYMSGYKARLLKRLTKYADFPEPLNTPATFHQPPERVDHLRYQYDKLRISSGVTETLNGLPRRRASLEKQPKKTGQPHQPTHSKVLLDSYTPSSATSLKQARVRREKRLRRTASLNQKEAALQQRIKNKVAVDDWRQAARKLQQQKQYEVIRKGITKVKIPSPFAIEESEAKGDFKSKQRKENEYNKRLQELLGMSDKELSKKKQKRRRVLNDRELERRIKDHMKKIKGQRFMNFENVSDEVEEAKNNLQTAHKLHEELAQRQALEYRLRAFTGDDFVPNAYSYKNAK